MSERIIAVIDLLQQAHGLLRINELSAKLGVGDRSVRRYIQKANALLDGSAKISAVRPGLYQLKIFDQGEFSQALNRAKHISPAPDSPEERVSYLVNDLLSRADWVTLDTLAQILYVSRRTISTDLREVESMLTRFGLSLESRPYRGIRVVGDEARKRLCLSSMAFQRLIDSQGESSRGVTVESIKDCVDRALEGKHLAFSAINYHNLLVHIAIAVMRIRAHAYVPMEGSDLDHIRGTRAYAAAEDVARELTEQFDVDLPSEEIAYIALHLAGKQMPVEGSASQPSGSDRQLAAISDEVWDVVSDMIDVVWSIYQIDFHDDLELRMNLARHVAPLSIRLRHHMVAENPLTDEICVRCPLAWSMAVDASHVLERRYGSELQAPEIGYLALAFALAIERSGSEPPKKSVLIVCASGAGTARLLEYRCRKEFGAYVDSIRTCDVSQVERMDFSGIDYVFTMVPLGIEVPVPVREVSAFLDPSDVVDIIELLRRDFPEGLLRYFPRELFFGHMAGESKEEVLSSLVDKAAEHFGLNEEFRELVFERESIAPTAFGNRVALPHPARAVAGVPFVAVGLLEHPIGWGAHEVQVVFLISFSNDPGFNPDEFNDGIAALLSSEEAIGRLLEERSYATLQALLSPAGDAHR